MSATRPTPAALPGDYNDDGTVNAGDYTVWRESVGTDFEMPNDATPGHVGNDDYAVWKANFGAAASLPGSIEWMPGDYNDDGIVDTSDYSVWRDNLGTSIDLANDVTPGSVTNEDYLVWKANFGASLEELGQAEGPVTPPLETPWTPIVSAGPDKSADVSTNVTLNADVIVNQPDDPQHTWSMVSGPGSVDFGNENSEDTTAIFSAPGSYVLQLSVTNHGVAASDRVTVNVQGQTAGTPELPREYINTTLDPAYNRAADIIVRAGDNLQAALDSAQPGDIVELEAGATFTGNFVLRNKSGNDWIYIRSSAYATLPAAGTRVTPAQANLMPNIVSANSMPAITTELGAHHYRLIGLEVTTSASLNYGIVVLGSHGSQTATTTAQLPHHITFDRMYIHGTPTGDMRRGIAMNSRHTAVIDSYLSDFHERGSDTQAIAAWSGDGPFKIVNNYLEAAGENVMFGGAGNPSAEFTPSDIEIRGNHFFKPLSWNKFHADYDGIQWVVKNSFELKMGVRVLVEGNVFENHWAGQGQSGYAIVLTPRTNGGATPWARIDDVTFRNNVVKNVSSGFNVLSVDAAYTTGNPMDRVSFENNLLIVNQELMGSGEGKFILMLSGSEDNLGSHIAFRHNTMVREGSVSPQSIMTGESRLHSSAFVFQDNIVEYGTYGVIAGATGTGALNNLFTSWTFSDNALIDSSSSQLYPAGNYYPSAYAAVGFVDTANGNYRLASNSPYKNKGTDGKDLGADITSLMDIISEVTAFSAGTSAALYTGSPTDQPYMETPNHAQPTTFWSGMSQLSWLPTSADFAFAVGHGDGGVVADSVTLALRRPARLDLVLALDYSEIGADSNLVEINDLVLDDSSGDPTDTLSEELLDDVFAIHWNGVSL